MINVANKRIRVEIAANASEVSIFFPDQDHQINTKRKTMLATIGNLLSKDAARTINFSCFIIHLFPQ